MTEVAVVGFAHAPHARRTDGTTNGVEMLMPCFAEIYADLGLKQTEIGFRCSGASDYLAGRAFAFVSGLDSIGAVPPIHESTSRWTRPGRCTRHGWVLTGEVDTALVYGFGKSSAGNLHRIMALQTDPYTSRHCGRTRCRMAGLQARFGLDAGKWTAEQMAQVRWTQLRHRRRIDSLSRPRASTSCWRRYFADPLRRPTSRRSPTARRRSCSPPAISPARCASGPPGSAASSTASRRPVLGVRDLTASPSTAASAQAATGGDAARSSRRAVRAVQPRGADPHRGARANGSTKINPSGGRWRPTR